MSAHNPIQPIFIGIWIFLMVSGGIYHLTETNFRRKQIVVRIYFALAGVSFAVFTFLSGGPVIFFLPVLAGITLLNMFTIRICPSCGKTNRNSFLFPLPTYCQKCGAPL